MCPGKTFSTSMRPSRHIRFVEIKHHPSDIVFYQPFNRCASTFNEFE